MNVSLREARRIVLAAQGFGRARPDIPSVRHLRGAAERLSLFQIDSVNVLTRAHYLPAFSRPGGYETSLPEGDAWGPKRQRRLSVFARHVAPARSAERTTPPSSRCGARRYGHDRRRWCCWRPDPQAYAATANAARR
ncbi:hypothetical protein [Sphingomonas sp. Leaf21]|jgi:uncharacterized protein YcaQ|uniref:hypothetical protein n=1 Tax=Sphingomonas sp. Leaf21 TaxID=2876550 RepID=UPI001E35A236|nr:hypothetical protein [Sphingomonas sp. Leaf21]